MTNENWKYEHLVRQIHKTAYKPHESFIISSLLHDIELIDLLPLTQYYVRRIDNKYALIDLFYPQLNLAIEIDEPHHNKYLENDIKRQNDIKENINCHFTRIRISDGNIIDQIINLKTKILRLKKELNGKLNIWKEPKYQSIFQMKAEYRNTLFLKIRGFIKPEDLMARQTGFWIIKENKRCKIENIVVIHDSVITRVFKLDKWIIRDNKVGYSGIENQHSEILGNIVSDWKTQKTTTYSNDVY